ncbi:MAG: ParB/RepB/Spo0J family partition protein [Bdellovibrionaceae bacterium]|jgi:ParB family chromosome partitioning protein|nr:ParB/RepB/Spo0J family partition protein [Pseudobdellovibrionaceae bacterium]
MEISKENKNKKNLGRGIGSLLGGHVSIPELAGETPSATKGKDLSQVADVGGVGGVKVQFVPIEKLVPSPYQPRQNFSPEELSELAQSIKEKGVLQPLLVRRMGDKGFEIIAGERRWRACQKAGIYEVPVIIKEFDDRETLEVAIIENIQRSNLNPIEEAKAYWRLAQEFDLSQNQIAEKVGKDRATVANIMRLMALAPQVQDMLASGRISLGHAKVLLSVKEPEKQFSLAQQAERKNLSVRALEKLLKTELTETLNHSLEGEQEAGDQKQQSWQLSAKALAERLSKKWGTKVEITGNSHSGELTIKYYSADQLNELAERWLGDS